MGKKGKNLTERIWVTVHPDVKAQIEAEAAEQSVTMSDVVRQLVVSGLSDIGVGDFSNASEADDPVATLQEIYRVADAAIGAENRRRRTANMSPR